jgi:hypothetical protein
MPSSTPHDVIDALTKRTQDGGTEVVEAKAGKVSSPGCDALASRVCIVPFYVFHNQRRSTVGHDNVARMSSLSCSGSASFLFTVRVLLLSLCQCRPNSARQQACRQQCAALARCCRQWCMPWVILNLTYARMQQLHMLMLLRVLKLHCVHVLAAGLCHSVHGIRSSSVR